jgi:glycosyltransferase involved in cell wall biosynthesis
VIRVSVLIVTLNEEERLPNCLAALQDFDEIIVIDSGSTDKTVEIAKSFGANVETFNWNGKYPKKRQWCLDNLDIKNEYIFFVDADEIVTPELIQEIRTLDFSAAGYFIRGKYIWNNKRLHYGLKNNKLMLFNRNKIGFPVVDDLDIDGMGEIEGHYQPIFRAGVSRETIYQLKAPLIHDAYEGWEKRHKRYAVWESAMIRHNAYPAEVNAWREWSKGVFRNMPFRGFVAFIHSYIFKLGFLDGRAGFDFALSRMWYYKIVSAALKTNKAMEKNGGVDRAKSAI